LALIKPFICISEYQIARYLEGRELLTLCLRVDIFNYCKSGDSQLFVDPEKTLEMSSVVEEEVFNLEKYRKKTRSAAPLGKCEEIMTTTHSMDNISHIQNQIVLIEKLKQEGLQYLVPNSNKSPSLNTTSMESSVKIDVQKSPVLKL
jgi:microsomal dipeptidase-like Zn-dependent dipeptidase